MQRPIALDLAKKADRAKAAYYEAAKAMSAVTVTNTVNVEKRDDDVRNNYAEKQAAIKAAQTPTKLFSEINPTLNNASSAVLG